MLATGAVANWLAGVVAQQTTESQISETAIAAYQHFFSQMGEWTLGCVAVIVLLALVASCSVGKRRTAAQGDKLVSPGSPAKAFTPRAGGNKSTALNEQEGDSLAGAEANDKKYR